MAVALITAVVALVMAIMTAVKESKEIPAKVRNSKKHMPRVIDWFKINQRATKKYMRYLHNPRNFHRGNFSAPKNPIKWAARINFVGWQRAEDWPGKRLIRPIWDGKPHPPHLGGWPADKCHNYLKKRWTLLALMEPMQHLWNTTRTDTSDMLEEITQEETTDQALLDLIFPPSPSSVEMLRANQMALCGWITHCGEDGRMGCSPPIGTP